MWELFSFCFNGDDKEFIGITRYGAIWTNSQEKHRLSINKTSLKLAINYYLLDNSYFTFVLTFMCFRQLIRIPVGSDPVLFMAKTFLYYYEGKWLPQTRKQDRRKACIFLSILRFMEDICTFNNNKFENDYNDIYPDKLNSKRKMKILVIPRFWTFQ